MESLSYRFDSTLRYMFTPSFWRVECLPKGFTRLFNRNLVW